MLNINIAVITDFIKYFGNKQIEEKAKGGFVKRNDGKLIPATFVRAFTVGLWTCQKVTLPQIVQICEDIQAGLTITRQALHQRLKPGAVLLKELFIIAMDYSINHTFSIHSGGVFSQFKNIYICDATYLTLPAKLKAFFRGNGGKSKVESSLKIQTTFNVTTRSFTDIQIHEGIESDDSYLENLLGILKVNDLIIHDLGYFNKDFFREVNNKGAYYVSRIQNRTAFYPSLELRHDRPMPVEKIFDESKGFIDIRICIGQKKKTRLSVRLIAIKLPPDVVNQRLRRANINSRGRTLSKNEKTLLSWNIVITNAEADKLPPEKALELYKIRWQIEIIFKSWKSYLGLRNIAHGGKYQVECLLYGRLIVITLLTAIYSHFYMLLLLKQGRELSILKFISLLKYKSGVILTFICEGLCSSLKLASVLSKIAINSIYEKHKRQTTMEIIMEFVVPKLVVYG